MRRVLDQAMVDNPTYWQPFYPSDPALAARARRYSRSDRSRYYWPVPSVQQAVDLMVANLRRTGIPGELLSQFLPVQSRRVAAGALDDDPSALLGDTVRVVLDDYAAATAER